jgi:hypothetical protein
MQGLFAVRFTVCAVLIGGLWGGCAAPWHPGGDGSVEPPGLYDRDVVFDRANLDATQDGERGCEDHDGDGFGVGCARGPDCDDTRADLTDECYRCMRSETGCPCEANQTRPNCDAVTDSDLPGPGGSCHPGQRVCIDGRWSRCLAFDGRGRTVLPPTSCRDSCNPACRTQIGCPDSAADLATSSGVVLGSAAPSGFCPMGPGGGLQLPMQPSMSGGGRDAGVDASTCTGGGACAGLTCGCGQSCVTVIHTGRGGTLCTGSGSGVSSTEQYCGLACPSGTTHCGVAPLDQCCPSGYVCHQGGCLLNNPAGCHDDTDCALVSSGQHCISGTGVCSTGGTRSGSTNFPGACPSTGSPPMGCFASGGAHGFQIVADIFNTNDGRDARSLRFARYLRGMERSLNDTMACNGSSKHCAVGVSTASSAPFACTASTCDPSDATRFRSFPLASTGYDAVAPFTDALDWRWVDFVRDPSASNPWQGLMFDLGRPSNQVVIFPIRDGGPRCLTSGMDLRVWLTDNPGATEVAAPGTYDPQKWNEAWFRRMFTEGWTRNPRALGRRGDTASLSDASAGNAIADGWASVWAIGDACFAFRYVAILPGNAGEPNNPCRSDGSSGVTNMKIDAVAGLDADGTVPSIFHLLPYGASAGPDALSTSVTVSRADLYFLLDTSASASGGIAALRTALSGTGAMLGCTAATGGIVGATRCQVPDAWFGLGEFSDFPVAPYGVASDRAYVPREDLTLDAARIATTLSMVTARGGGDVPASQVPALWAMATGNAIGYAMGPAARTCPPDDPSDPTSALRIGHPCFRRGTLPLVLLLTDSEFHNGPGGSMPYAGATLGGTPPTYAQAVTELNTLGARVAVINLCGGSGCASSATSQATQLATDTRSVRTSTGLPAAYTVSGTGAALATALRTTAATAVGELLDSLRMDVTAIAEDNPATAVDERCFVATPSGAPMGAVALASTPFVAGACVDTVGGYQARGCVRGAAVNFTANFSNRCVPAATNDQTFTFDLVFRGNGRYELGRVPVTIVVPGAAYPASGTYTQIVDASRSCAPGQLPIWKRVLTDGATPAGTRIDVAVRSATTAAELSLAPWVDLGSITTAPPAPALPPGGTISDALRAARQPSELLLLEVRFTLNSNLARTATPVISGYQVQFDCDDRT